MWLIILLTIIATIVVLYLLAIMPKITGRHVITPWQGRYYAHRGLHQNKNETPENSMAAFHLAVSHNYGIEMDVQLSKDKIPVVFHDYNLRRVCGIDKKVRDLTFAELQELTLYQSTEQIPAFQSVLDMVNGQVPLIVEFKVELHDTSVCSIAAPILDRYKGLYCIESFNPLVLLWYKNRRPNIMRGQLSSNLIKDKEVGSASLYFILQNLLLNFITKPDFISFNYAHRDMLSFVLCRHLYKIPAFAWTIKTQESLNESRNSFDFFIFDHFIPQG
ncbi:MAG: glycerophosphodiester phosphodiesterase family protein [Anaerocolumna sp.]